MATVEERIEATKAKLEQLKAQKAKIEARKRAEEVRKNRAADTRRKVLIGAFVLEQMERNGIGPGLMTYESKRFADWLTRDADRALFNLPAAPGETRNG